MYVNPMLQTEVNIFYGHKLYAKLNGKEFCDCEECVEIRKKIYKSIWKKSKR